VRIWDPGSQDLLKILLGHSAALQALAWSPDGKHLASAGDDCVVRVWDAEIGRLLHTLRGHEASVRALSWSRDGKRLASGGNDKTVRLWDAEVGQPGRAFTRHDQPVTFVAWRPDGKLVSVQASGDGPKRAWLWQDAPTPDGRYFDFDGPAAWSADYKVLACRDGQMPGVRFWNADEGKVERTLELKGQEKPVCALAWSANGKMLATGDGVIARFWEADSGRLVQTTVHEFEDRGM
jgi:WD40 repeat protein